MADLLEFEEPIGILLKEIEALSMLPATDDRNREIALCFGPIVCWFAGLFTLDVLVRAGVLANSQAHYFFVVAIGAGLLCLAFAYVSQAETAELRQYLRRRH